MNIRVHHLSCGTMCPICERLVNGQGSWMRAGRMVCHCLLVEAPDALVLVDTGLGTADVEDPRRLGPLFNSVARPRLSLRDTAISQIRELGHDPRDVRHIVPTHLDADHAGGLSDFPHARVHIFGPELYQVRHPADFRERIRFRQAQFQHGPEWIEYAEEGERWFGFSSIRAIPGLRADILLIPLIGHTRGHVGVAVRQGERWLLHCGDAYFHRSEVTASPDVPLGLGLFEKMVQTLPEPRRQNQGRLRELAAAHGDEVELFCAHDTVEFERYAPSGPGGQYGPSSRP